MAKTRKPKRGGQTEIPGTEIPDIPELIVAAENQRIAEQKAEQAKANLKQADKELKAILDRCEAEGTLRRPSGISDSPVVYHYPGNDGNEYNIEHRFGKESVKVTRRDPEDGEKPQAAEGQEE